MYGRSGRREQARLALAKFEQSIRHASGSRIGFLLAVYAGMDRKDETIALFRKEYAEHSNALAGLNVEPNFDPLCSDPRFQELLRRVGLAQ